MKGFVQKTALGLGLGMLVSLAAGCVAEYRERVDPCWPERYNYLARQSVRGTFNAQAMNGHILDQTVWNQHFEPGTDRLNDAGRAHLKYLARRMPAPDPQVFVQPAYDIEGPILDVNALKDLNEKRVASVQRYLTAMMALRNMPVSFEVALRDAAEPGLPSRAAANLYQIPARTQEERQAAQDLNRAGATQVQNTTVTTTGGAPTAVQPQQKNP
jgi:hypothetical protein